MNNIYQVIGYVGKDPEIRNFDTGKMCSFSVATNSSYKNKQGEKITETEWHNVVSFNPNLVDIVEKYVSKGQQVAVSGSMKTRQRETQSGEKRYTSQLMAKQILLLSGNKQESSEMPSAENIPEYDSDDLHF